MATVHELAAMSEGDELGVSEWLTIDQVMIDQFAAATGDYQFIHVDPVRAKSTPFGGTIAHGFLLLSLMPVLIETTPGMKIDGAVFGVNYGGNKVRFVSPVRSGSRVRGRFNLLSMIEKAPNQWQQITSYTLEVEGASKPALIAEWIGQVFV